MKIVALFVVLTVSALAKEIPTGNWDELYEEIHGNGVYTTANHKEATSRAKAIARDVEDLDGLADRTNVALRAIFKVAVRNLKLYGYTDEARTLQSGWKNWDGQLQRIVGSRRYADSRDIGDFPGLIAWIDQAYDVLELTLGYKLCYTLRLTDIKTINRGLVVVFQPCKHGATQMLSHSCGDLHTTPLHPMPYRGLINITAYWVTSFTCSMATFGAGAFFICSPLAYLVELSFDKWLCEPIQGKIYEWACN